MASTAQTSWTNQTVDLLKSNPHVDCKPVLKQLIPETLKTGIRFISRQTKPTEGTRHLRLDAWYYIRLVKVDDVLRALRETGFWSEQLKKDVQDAMQTQNVYHVVVRGNDPIFMPLGRCDGQDLVTNYCCERLSALVEEVDKHLFDELADAANLQLAMEDPSFEQMLEHYFRSGKQDKEATLHLVGRFRGGSNLLHSCIKEGHLETLKLLLDQFTSESQKRTPWRVLAEPLRPVGQHRISAFHRAVFDGRPDCLSELVAWAQRHGHDITELQNSEEYDPMAGPGKGWTCLELAEEEGNMACYNVLAEAFNVPAKEGGKDANPREARLAQLALPRVELEFAAEEQPLIQPMSQDILDWASVIHVVKTLKSSSECRSRDSNQFVLRLANLAFEEDATDDQVADLLAEAAGMALEANSCTWKTDKTGLSFLKVVVERLAEDPTNLTNAAENQCLV
ncbi:unnamed protein product [Effrenium voratum]|nr:unnamed protein product [Effrenium voratum]